MNSLRRRSRALWAGLTLLLILLLAACYPDNPQSTFGVSGPVAQSQLNLLYWILGAALFVFVVVGAILMYITIRYRRRAGDGDPEQIHGNTPLEIGWTIAPSLVLVVIAVPTVLTVFDNLNSPDPNAMTVDVVGHQWWFEFKYPHPDGESTVVTANELHIPVGEVVNINLDSKDVLHSFWIPKIAGKVDLVPGNKNFMWIQADEAGEYLGQCAEFCGEAHALMKFRVVAESRADFDAWLAGEAAAAEEPVDPLAQQGKALFEGSKAQCWSCHAVTGSDKSRGQTGPNLTHVWSRSHIAAGVVETNQENLRQWLEDPQSIKQGTIMYRDAKIYTDPDNKLTDADVAALVAYLQTLE